MQLDKTAHFDRKVLDEHLTTVIHLDAGKIPQLDTPAILRRVHIRLDQTAIASSCCRFRCAFEKCQVALRRVGLSCGHLWCAENSREDQERQGFDGRNRETY